MGRSGHSPLPLLLVFGWYEYVREEEGDQRGIGTGRDDGKKGKGMRQEGDVQRRELVIRTVHGDTVRPHVGDIHREKTRPVT